MLPGDSHRSRCDCPEPWEAHRAKGTEWTFFYNKDTGESTWKHPQQGLPTKESERTQPDGPEVDERGRLKPRPKKRPRTDLDVLGPIEKGENGEMDDVPYGAKMEIQAGSLTLRSANMAKPAAGSLPPTTLAGDETASSKISTGSPGATDDSAPAKDKTRPGGKTKAKKATALRKKATAGPPKPKRSIWFDIWDKDEEEAPSSTVSGGSSSAR